MKLFRISWIDTPDLDESDCQREVGLVLAESIEDAKTLYPLRNPETFIENELFSTGAFVYEELTYPDEVRDMMTNLLWEIDFITDDRIREAMVKGITNAISEMVL